MSNQYSNAPEGFPDVSDSGYPLFYPLGEGNKPTGPARLVFDGQTFEDEKEIENYKKRLLRREDNAQKWMNTAISSGPFSINQASQPGVLEWMWGFRLHYNQTTWRDFFFDMLNGDVIKINELKQRASVLNPGSVPSPAPDAEMARFADELMEQNKRPAK